MKQRKVNAELKNILCFRKLQPGMFNTETYLGLPIEIQKQRKNSSGIEINTIKLCSGKGLTSEFNVRRQEQ